MSAINKKNQYFVIRMKDDTKLIYKDAKGLFEKSKPTKEYEIIEVIEEISVKFSKKAKHKDYSKTKTRLRERAVTEKKVGEKIYIETKESRKKNSVKTVKKFERVLKKVQVWSDEFDFSIYEPPVRVIRSLEQYWHEGKVKMQ